MDPPLEIKTLPIGDELHICPNCGYERGFHSTFVRAITRSEPVDNLRNRHKVVLCCPNCGVRYDIGCTILLPGSGI